MKLPKHLFCFSNTTSEYNSNIEETIDNILERSQEIFYDYKDKEGYKDIRMACSRYFDDYPAQVFLEIYYKAPNESTKVIQFNFYPYARQFEVSGERIGWGERRPLVTTYDEDEAYFLLEQRIKEIPLEMRTLFNEYPHCMTGYS